MDAGLSRDEVERVLRRASALASEVGDPAEDRLPAAAVVEAAAEVGIPAAAVHQAIALERLGETEGRQRGDRVVGPATVVVQTTLAMPVPEVMARLDAWLVQGHHLRRERWSAREAEWGRRSGLVAAGSRAARSATGEGRLGEVRRLTVRAHETHDGSTVRVAVDRHLERTAWAGGGAALAAVGTTGVAAAAIAAAPLFLVAAPLAVGAGLAVARGGRSQAEGVEREVERLLAAVAGRATPTPLRKELTKWARRRG